MVVLNVSWCGIIPPAEYTSARQAGQPASAMVLFTFKRGDLGVLSGINVQVCAFRGWAVVLAASYSGMGCSSCR